MLPSRPKTHNPLNLATLYVGGRPAQIGHLRILAERYGAIFLAALSVLDGTGIGRCMQRHRHCEFIRFLNPVEREVPTGKLIHASSESTTACAGGST